MSPKQQVFQDLFRMTLPSIRNTQTHGPWHKAWDRSSYFYAELVHNLYVSMFEPEFVDHDLHFLNHQARSFFERATSRECAYYDAICARIGDLFALAPEDVRSRLTWSGPPRRSVEP